MSGLTYLISGANRGIGKGLLEVFVARDSTTVIAAVRDVERSTKDLESVTVGNGSKIIIVKIDATVDTDPAAAIEELESKYKITKVDTVIANSGLMGMIAPTLQTPAQEVRSQFEVNTIGPLNLIQAFYPLLEKSAAPKFLVLSSSIGSISDMESLPVPFFGYGLSKAAANYLVRKLHFENEKLTSVAFNPGWVQTPMGNGAAKGVGMKGAPMTVEESVNNLVALFDSTSRERSGTFIDSSGEPIGW
jgi:norsolorinic acid ketoreductase